MMRIDSRDMDKLNQQVACSDLFGGGGRKESFQPALPQVERSPRWNEKAGSHGISSQIRTRSAKETGHEEA